MQLKPTTVIVVLLLVAASLLVAGCTDNQTQSNSSKVSVSAQYQGVYAPPPSYGGTLQPGYMYVKLYVTAKNINANGVDLDNPYDFTLFDTTNQGYGASYITFIPSDAIKVIRDSQPGDTTAGTLVLEIKAGATPQKLVYNDGSNKVTVSL
jgi:hypothetical protein